MRNINSAAGRRDIVRVRLSSTHETWQAFPVLGKSGAISSLSRAHGYFIIDEDTQGVPGRSGNRGIRISMKKDSVYITNQPLREAKKAWKRPFWTAVFFHAAAPK